MFAGYKVPHPLEHNFVLKVQTDGALPVEVLQNGVDQLIGDLSLLEERVKVRPFAQRACILIQRCRMRLDDLRSRARGGDGRWRIVDVHIVSVAPFVVF